MASLRKKYFGTSVFYIPQSQPVGAEFFLYPGHQENLMEALKIIKLKRSAHKKGDN